MARLEEIRRKVDESKSKASRLQGELESHLKRAKTEYKLNSLEEIERRLKALRKERAELEESRDTKQGELERKYANLIAGRA